MSVCCCQICTMKPLFRYLNRLPVSNTINFINGRHKLIVFTHRCASQQSKNAKGANENHESENNKSRSTCADDNTERQTIRKNPLGIQMLSSSLHKQIFISSCNEDPSKSIDGTNIRQSVEHLKAHGLWGIENPVLPEVDIQLPKLRGRDLDEHFHQLAIEQSDEYRSLAQKLANATIPPVPKIWKYAPGWTRYNCDGSTESIDYPPEGALVFDVEVLVPEGDVPTMATAVSDSAWYSWCSKRLVEDHITIAQKKWSTDDLIPLETKLGHVKPENVKWHKRVIIGHNVSYDRARIKEQYLIEGTKMRFLDTMSLHIASSGLTGLQRALYISEETGSRRKEVEEAKAKARGPPMKQWMKVGSLNNLVDVHKLYCKGPALRKDEREIFVNGTMMDVRKNFQELMSYCARDVRATHEILHVLLPIFLKRFPHPVTFAGMLEMGCAYLPVNNNWERYISEAQMTYEDLEKEMKLLLTRLANDACELLHGNKYKTDPWLWDLNWQIKELRSKKSIAVKKKAKDTKTTPTDLEINSEDVENANHVSAETVPPQIKSVLDTAKNLYVKRPIMAGYPTWYNDLCPKPSASEKNRTPGPRLISTQMQVTPKLLRMTWDGYPLYYSKKNGWGYLVPGKPLSSFDDDDEFANFPLVEITNFCKMHDGHTATTNSISNLDSLWERILEGVADPYEEAKLWESVMCGEREETETRKRNKASKKDESAHHGNGPFEEENIPGCYFYRLPHKDGPQNRVGNPLAKDFLNKIEDRTLRSSGSEQADSALKLSKMISYWRNAHKRIESQMVVWLKREELPRNVLESNSYDESNQYGAIIPKIITAGTVTRRAVEPTWLTASNAYVDRVGSELKSMVQAFPGYHFVGADVDSQELWIAAILGDAHFCKMHGCTAFGWMTLQGKKINGTDMHSKTASTAGISRDQAKVMNYGRIYGAGQPFASRLLMQFNHRLTEDGAKARAQTMYAATKGVRGYTLNNLGRKLMEPNEHVRNNQKSTDGTILTRKEVFKLLRESQSDLEFNDIIDKCVWIGGTESAMFNKLEAIAMSPEAKTPVLNCSISRALESTNVMENFMTSRVNWVVQSSAVDYLHLMLVSMRWLFDTYDISGRFCISIHDEVRYHVKSEDRYRAALALQITNLLTRALFAFKLGMNDLPQSVAFFSAVDIDTVLRKEVDLDCKTPSNLHGLQNGYGISAGIALDIDAIQKKTNGSLTKS